MLPTFRELCWFVRLLCIFWLFFFPRVKVWCMYCGLALNSWYSCLCLPSTGITSTPLAHQQEYRLDLCCLTLQPLATQLEFSTLKMSSFCLQALFQVTSKHLWLVATILDNVIRKCFHQSLLNSPSVEDCQSRWVAPCNTVKKRTRGSIFGLKTYFQYLGLMGGQVVNIFTTDDSL